MAATGTQGAPRLRIGSSGLRNAVMPETFGLWMLVGLELLFMVSLRRYFRRHHGG
jgi:hypothetical protein